MTSEGNDARPPMRNEAGVVERLREEALAKARSSFDCQDCGIASNLAEEAATALEAKDAEIARLTAEADARANSCSILIRECDAATTRATSRALTAEAALAEAKHLATDRMYWMKAYYEMLDGRLPGHGQPVAELQTRGILLDGSTDGGNPRLLLQIFSQTQLGPVFFEFIQRKGDEGFGEGNFKALFESLERDQIRRGALSASEV